VPDIIDEILDKLERREPPSRNDLVTLLKTEDTGMLFAAADRIRQRYVGSSVHIRGIVEFSNYCIKNCLYCGLRKGNDVLTRYRMMPEEIISAARKGAQTGIKTIVLQSGEDPFYTAEILADILRRLKNELGVAITVSVGDRTKKDYTIMKKAGADRYLLKQETADPALFARLRPGTTLEGRKKRLMWLKELGYQVGSGGMVGLPGQTMKSIADDILLMAEIDVEMAGIGPFIPNGNTPLAHAQGGNAIMTLKALAVARLVMPFANLPSTTSLATIHPEGRQLALTCGGNVIMPDITPIQYKRLYEIYPNKSGMNDDGITDSVPKITQIIHGLGRTIATDYGHGRSSSI
jgi:biotin synthase